MEEEKRRIFVVRTAFNHRPTSVPFRFVQSRKRREKLRNVSASQYNQRQDKVMSSPWRQYQSPSGKSYFHNKRTNETTWERPDSYEEPAASSGPKVFIQVENAQGKTYYYNQADESEVVWVLPKGARAKTRRQSALEVLAQGNSKGRTAAVQELSQYGSPGAPQAAASPLKPPSALPPGWQEVTDPNTQKVYYWNKNTNETSWTVPKSGGGTTRLTLTKKKKKRENVVGESVGDEEYVHRSHEKSAEASRLIKQALQENFVFSKYPEATLRQFIDVMAPMKVSAGKNIITQGEKGDDFYVIERGTCEIYVDNVKVASYKAGNSFGELAMYYKSARAATIKARTNCSLFTIDGKTFRQVSAASMFENVDIATDNLMKIEWLNPLGEELISKVAGACALETVKAGTTIIRKNEKGDKFYIIKKGAVKCFVSETDEPLQLSDGQYFGELALLKDQPRAATVEAVVETQLLTLNRDPFHYLLGPIHEQLNVNYDSHKVIERSAIAAPSRATSRRATVDIKLNLNNIQREELQMKKVLGEGTFGRVELCYHQRTNTSWALKTQQKTQIAEAKQQKACMLEKKVMACLRHPFILLLEATYQTKDLLFMLLECVPGGELFQLLAQRPAGCVPSDHAKFYGGCVIDAFSYMHEQKVVYRDLKPENLLIDRRGYIKVIDFGFGKFLDKAPYRTMTFCGTPEYFAPEIMMGKGYDYSVDVWGVGILIYEMIYGYTPFADHQDGNPHKTMQYIMKNKVSYPTDGNPDRVAKKLIDMLLQKNSTRRLGCGSGGTREVKKHEWFTSSNFNWDALESIKMQAPWVPPLSGDHDVVEPMEQYSSQYRVRPYRGDQKWCAEW